MRGQIDRDDPEGLILENQIETDYVGMTADIVSAYVSSNHIDADKIAELIQSVHASLVAVSSAEQVEDEEIFEKATPAQIRKSITPDYLISFEDGRKYKSMRRSLSLRGLTPEAYREKWGLPKDYPMVSPNYAAARSALAKASGLGQGGRKPAKRGQSARKS